MTAPAFIDLDAPALNEDAKVAIWRRIVAEIGGFVSPPAGFVAAGGQSIRTRCSYEVPPGHPDYVGYWKGRIDGLRTRAESDEVLADNFDEWAPEDPARRIRRQARAALSTAEYLERDLFWRVTAGDSPGKDPGTDLTPERFHFWLERARALKSRAQAWHIQAQCLAIVGDLAGAEANAERGRYLDDLADAIVDHLGTGRGFR